MGKKIKIKPSWNNSGLQSFTSFSVNGFGGVGEGKLTSSNVQQSKGSWNESSVSGSSGLGSQLTVHMLGLDDTGGTRCLEGARRAGRELGR